MAIYQKKPIEVEAHQWWSNGDHPLDDIEDVETQEGKIVRYFRHPKKPGTNICSQCSHLFHFHGFLETLEGGAMVCPGDYIIKGVEGELYCCKGRIFEETYERVN